MMQTMTCQDFNRHTNKAQTLAEWFSQANPEIADVDWELSPRSTAQRAELDWSDE